MRFTSAMETMMNAVAPLSMAMVRVLASGEPVEGGTVRAGSRRVGRACAAK